MRLRVIAGALRSRRFEAPRGFATHPMGERVRGALFNKLGDISGLRVLDAYGGSGALSFEAVSRGARSAVVIERDRKAQQTIDANITLLNLKENVHLIKAGCRSWSDTYTGDRFDIILCDPPYHQLKLSTIEALTAHMQPNGRMILSHTGRESAPTVNGVVVVDSSQYGDAALVFYRKNTA